MRSATGLGDSTTTVVARRERPRRPSTTTVRAAGRRDVRPAALYAARADGVVTIYANLGADGESQGSGFVVDRTGAILTNAHVITNVAELEPRVVAPSAARGAVYVEFSDGERVPARIVGWDLFSDVGVIRVDARPTSALEPVPLGDSRPGRRGRAGRRDRQPVRQADVPLRRRRVGHRPVDRLAHVRGFAVANAIQTDAPINRGNSGGRSSTATAA